MKRSWIGAVVSVLTLLVVAVLAFAVGGSALAQGTEPPAVPPPVPALTDVLAMLASGIGVGAVIAFLFEKFQWFQDMAPNTKWWVVLGLSLGLPVLARVALQFVPPDIWAKVEPYWAALATGFLIWAGSQVTHKFDQSRAMSTQRGLAKGNPELVRKFKA